MQNKTRNARHQNFQPLKSQILPSGLMVFSSDSLSFDFPLDMSAAMENAFALEESCGFGEEVYSMMRVLKTILNCTNVQSKPRNYFKLQDDILVRIKKIATGCYFQSGWDIVCRVLLVLLHHFIVSVGTLAVSLISLAPPSYTATTNRCPASSSLALQHSPLSTVSLFTNPTMVKPWLMNINLFTWRMSSWFAERVTLVRGRRWAGES